MIYIASKTKHAPKWRQLRSHGYSIISTWIDEAGPDETKDYPDLWERCVLEAASADVLLAYREAGEVLKGALVEIGAALARERPVLLVGFDNEEGAAHTWTRHPLCRHFKSVVEVLKYLDEVYYAS